jgi:hypothetical protein
MAGEEVGPSPVGHPLSWALVVAGLGFGFGFGVIEGAPWPARLEERLASVADPGWRSEAMRHTTTGREGRPAAGAVRVH